MNQEKLMFSHVWEDPELESSVLRSFNKSSNLVNSTKMLMVCSGGDTLIHILCKNHDDINRLNMTIDVLDNNRLQLAVCVFKILLLHYSDSSTYLRIMYGSHNNQLNNREPIDMVNILIDEYKDIEWSKYLKIWLEPQFEQILNNGLLKYGELEMTFKKLVDSQMNFAAEFDHSVLADRFGNAAVNLSEKCTFSDRFCEIYEKYLENYGNNICENRYYYRMFNNCDHESFVHDMCNKMKYVTIDDLKQINFILQDMLNYVSSCTLFSEENKLVTKSKNFESTLFSEENKLVTSPNKLESTHYDIIQTSNITDWLNSTTNVKNFISTILSNLNNRGIAIWRSLNGDYDLMTMLNTESNGIINVNIPFDDKSHFYKSTIITRKLCITDEENEIRLHPYFAKLDFNRLSDDKDILFTPKEFLHSQIPFYHAVDNWYKTLIYLRDKIIEKMISYHNSKREQINTAINIVQENINDETGNNIGNKMISHSTTFKAYLDCWATKVGINYVNISDPPERHMVKFNNSLYDMINKHPIEYACGCLAEIEYMYISISKIIKEFSDYHNVTQPHYTFHEILDYKHSTELFEMAVLLSDSKIKNKVNILEGAKFGKFIFMKLYKKMCYSD